MRMQIKILRDNLIFCVHNTEWFSTRSMSKTDGGEDA